MQTIAPHISQWILDTRPLWSIPDGLPSKEGMIIFKTTASESLGLLPAEEQQAVLKYYHPGDAKMSLASHLLKRYAISKLLNVPWPEATVSKGLNGKPIYVPPAAVIPDPKRRFNQRSIDFNVSHQAGIVILVTYAPPIFLVNDSDLGPAPGAAGPDLRIPECEALRGEMDLGTDIVCINERNDLSRIAREGFFAFVDMHADVFAPSETQALKMDSSSQLRLFPSDVEGQIAGYARDAIARCQYPDQDVRVVDYEGKEWLVEGSKVIDAKLRRFYALWCLREAWVKMTGEALLADWLQELEFRGFKVPCATPAAAPIISHHDGPNMSTFGSGALSTAALTTGRSISGQDHVDAGSQDLKQWEVVTEKEMQIWFKGKRVSGVKVELRSIGRDYMVATAARRRPMPGTGLTYTKQNQTNDGGTTDMVFGAWQPLLLEDIHAVARGFDA